ncbi:DEAD/DEAH box helicase [Propionibacteriaceae bacterium Y1700]|uniref:preprotein translocase subunit SecA n=1 Tax=Microlunatus sp. Y1700 TaxID=3418487 RepID=UPI003DA78A1F
MALTGAFNLLRSRRGRASLSGLATQRDAVLRVVERDRDRPLASLVPQVSLPPTRKKKKGNAVKKSEVEALAVLCRSASEHAGFEPFAEQILAALGLLNGFCVDMATGEGKTLAAVLAAGTYALNGRRVHVLCPNDYLATRDHQLAAEILTPLEISSAVVTEASTTAERQQAYRQHVVHLPVHEITYDLMRGNLVLSADDETAPRLDVAIVDEVDAVLLDEATQPLVIARTSRSDDDHDRVELALARLVQELVPGKDFVTGGDSASFTDAGTARVEQELGIDNLFDPDHVELATAANLALHADRALTRDVDYVIENDQIQLISATRGRVVHRQRWPEGLHRAVQIAEGLLDGSSVEILDQLTIQEVAKRYDTCIGMSGSASLAAADLHERYQLLTARIPQRRELRRIDDPVELYVTAALRDAAAVERVAEAHRAGQPVLIGTQSVVQSESFAALLSEHGIDAGVLNAKNPEDEASVIAEAGQAGRVTISTQMAGRGTDIVLTEDAREAGGLLVVAIECYPSPRLDAQLRGRSGRQGDPGSSVVFASLEDPLFAGGLPADERDGDEEGRVTSAGVLAAVEQHQRMAEGRLLTQHEHAWAFTRVISEHRSTVLTSRRHLLAEPAAATRELLRHLESEEADAVATLLGDDLDQMCAHLALVEIDDAWSLHLAHLTALREGIHLRRLARLSPLAEFDREARAGFEMLLLRAATAAADRLAEAVRNNEIPPVVSRDPGALWAYRVMDPNWGSPEDKFLQFVGERLRAAITG